MAKEKYIIVSDCWIDGKPVAKGTRIELDPANKEEGKKIALLNRAGRIGLATPENIRSVQSEMQTANAV